MPEPSAKSYPASVEDCYAILSPYETAEIVHAAILAHKGSAAAAERARWFGGYGGLPEHP